MGFEEYLTTLLEFVVTAVPSVAIVLYSFSKLNKRVTNQVREFPIQIKQTKENVTESLIKGRGEMAKIVQDFSSELKQDVQEKMAFMAAEMKGYKETLSSMRDYVNILAKENKAFMEIIVKLVAKDAKKIQEGISASIAKIVDEAEYNLRFFGDEMKTNVLSLEAALRKVLEDKGEEAVLELLERVGYGDKKEELQ